MEQLHRRSLPHWFKPGAAYFVTYRLSGTLPVSVVEELKATKDRLLKARWRRPFLEHRRHAHKVLFSQYDKYLDQASAIEWLRDPAVASMIRQNLFHHDGEKYHLHAYCIMPNHVHVVLAPSPKFIEDSTRSSYAVGEAFDKGSPLSRIMHSLKSYTANEANKLLERSGRFWQPESYDHWIRDEEEMERVVSYICSNPIAANLASKPEDWPWCSCHDRFQLDGDTSGWLPAS
ncbi:transposase [Rhodopirellula sp. SWK7]|uniref:transposase n=1 Tax=Rhodopirellula sp. SWK7 TaxID=595460 RepID=UPI0002BF439E|nr:transposase [Rhodopirellula sp. SWK7]EMI46808.1 protein containing DUF1568 [Rhodopirellula sp. SWK7]